METVGGRDDGVVMGGDTRCEMRDAGYEMRDLPCVLSCEAQGAKHGCEMGVNGEL